MMRYVTEFHGTTSEQRRTCRTEGRSTEQGGGPNRKVTGLGFRVQGMAKTMAVGRVTTGRNDSNEGV